MRTGERGFTYITVLILLFMVGLTQVKIATVWQTSLQREQEQELLQIGREFRRAIRSYYELTPGSAKKYPPTLQSLLEDQRFLIPAHHLRRIYPDPLTGQKNWGLIPAPDGGIMGVYSLSKRQPLKQQGFKLDEAHLKTATSYQQWRFVYEPEGGSGM